MCIHVLYTYIYIYNIIYIHTHTYYMYCMCIYIYIYIYCTRGRWAEPVLMLRLVDHDLTWRGTRYNSYGGLTMASPIILSEKPLIVWKKKILPEGLNSSTLLKIKGLSESIVGVSIVKSPYKQHLIWHIRYHDNRTCWCHTWHIMQCMLDGTWNMMYDTWHATYSAVYHMWCWYMVWCMIYDVYCMMRYVWYTNTAWTTSNTNR